MNTSDIITVIAGGGFGFIALLMTIIQIFPIKLDPWSWLFRKIGKIMNEEIDTKVNSLEKGLKKLQISCDERAMNDCRTRILRFNDEILHKQRHTKEHFDQILVDISNYEMYCSEHKDYKNNIANLAIKHVKDTYSNCEADGTYL